MPQFPGPLEWIVIAAVALIVFGPDKLPGIARSVGRAASELKRIATEARSEFEAGLDDEDDGEPTPPPRSAAAGDTAATAPGEALPPAPSEET